MIKLNITLGLFLAITTSVCLNACNSNSHTQNTENIETTTTVVTQLSFTNVNTYRHDPKAFTEGLLFKKGILVESTGKPDGQPEDSKIIHYNLANNNYKDTKITLPAPIFGEGSIILNGKIYWLTWKEGTCYVYNENTEQLTNTFKYQGEGWGMTTDGKLLIMSDGTNVIKFINPENFQTEKTINISYQGVSLSQINELEWVDDFIYANIFEQKIIVKINAQTGEVVGILDLTTLVNTENQLNPNIDVLNGIAYNSEKKTFYITGKYWTNIYEISIK